ncbi:regulator of chromosome condensation 1/beta-lactamase-inhibitor protein II [Gongronella butleri]|nr:regulator of chromosome condensation 1/beta-lactamase-inhibitor protein II [Gongronella butleri]
MVLVYSFGSNGGGQLGLGHVKDVHEPQLCVGLPGDVEIRKIVGGGNHSAVLSACGRLFVTGSSQRGVQQQKLWESSVNDDDVGQQWMKYEERWPSRRWRDVACGWASMLMVDDDDGIVYGVGTSRFGELGVVSKDDCVELTRIPGLPAGIDCVDAGFRHALALDKQGQLYAWGWNKYGQLGIAPSLETATGKKILPILPPTRVVTPIPIHKIACGHIHSYVLGIDSDKNTQMLLGAGANKYGQLTPPQNPELGKCDAWQLLHRVDDASAPRIRQIGSGWHHGAMVLDDGRVVMWGRNDHSQLAAMDNVNYVACGSEHVLAARDDGIVAWGWNEHGNCTTKQPFVHPPLSVTSLVPYSICTLGAGCATSWLVTIDE